MKDAIVKRRFWLDKIESALQERSVLWLAGVRRSGKTFLARSVPGVEYFDCELPRIRRLFEDPESFLQSMGKKTIVVDEVHRLDNPSELLKIAADHFPLLKIIATGSSTLSATTKFRDTLSGRKREIWLTPMVLDDLEDFTGRRDLERRLLHGGLPPFFMEQNVPERDFQEWMDSFWAKDIQELFRLEKRHSFLKFTDLLMQQSGGIFEATTFAAPCEISRTTVSNYLSVLDATFVVHIVRPFSSGKTREIIAAPRVYAMDTGFVCYHRGWYQLRSDDMGYLWEHLVLNELHAHLQFREIRYWRDKQGHEIDFVLSRRGRQPVAIECKWTADKFESGNLQAFRRSYPKGLNFVVSQDVSVSFERDYSGTKVSFVSLTDLVRKVSSIAE